MRPNERSAVPSTAASAQRSAHGSGTRPAAAHPSTHPSRTPVPRALLALSASLLVVVAARLGFAAVSTPEIAFEGLARLLGVPAVFNLVHALPFGLDRLAKPVLFVGVVAAWSVGAWLIARRLRPWASRLGVVRVVVLVTAASVALPGLVLLPAQGLGWFGLSPANRAWDPLLLHLAAAASGALFAAIAATGGPSAAADERRRTAVSTIARVTVALVAGSAVGGRWLVAQAQQAGDLFRRLVGLSPRITPVADHYVVSKNLFDPNVGERGWSLRIGGEVDRALELTLDDLRSLPSVTRPSTLICVSNPVGGDLIGTSEWTGVRLADLLELAGPRAGARELVLRAADNYSDSFPLDAAMREGTIVAYLQNGEPLTSAHGFPARVLVPGIYGMKNVKWVEEIALSRDDHLGYWQTRGWSDEAIVKTMSRIDTDVAMRLDDGRVAVGGVAFAGLRGVRSVEVSLDGGEAWLPTRVEPAPNELSWVRWAAVIDTDQTRLELRVRATDGEGVVQTAQPSRPLPDGADGHDRATVRVSG